MRGNNTIKNILILIPSIIVFFFFLELGLRIYSTLYYPRMMRLDDKIGWRHEARVSKTFTNEYGEKPLVIQNSHGHRGSYYDFKRENKKYRILVLGDSFTEGVHVREVDLFSARLEKMNPNLEVINAGVGGYGTVQEYLYLNIYGLKFNPDLVLLMFFNNDLSDNCLSYYAGFGPRPYASIKNNEIYLNLNLDAKSFRKFIFPFPFSYTLSRYSYLHYFLNTRIYQRIFADKMREFHKDDLEKIDNCRKYKIFYWIINQIYNVLRPKNIDFVMALIPSRRDVNKGHSQDHKPIIKFCQEHQIKCIQFIDRFVNERTLGVKPYFPRDIHWTSDGHRIVADEIGKFIRPIVNR